MSSSAAPPTPKGGSTSAVKRRPMNEEAWQNEFGKHRQRLENQKSYIPKALGSSYAPAHQQKSPRVPISPRSTRERAGGGNGGAPGRVSASMTLDSLSAAERRVCEDMISVLFNKTEEEGKAVLQAVFLAAESKRLLANYGGVYPSLDTMQDSTPE